MAPANARNLPPAPASPGDRETPRLPACPTTGEEPRPRVAPPASESDPHPVCQVLSARAYTHHSKREPAPRGGSADRPVPWRSVREKG